MVRVLTWQLGKDDSYPLIAAAGTNYGEFQIDGNLRYFVRFDFDGMKTSWNRIPGEITIQAPNDNE